MSRSPRVSRLWTAWQAARTLGAPWLCRRVWYEVQRKSGWLRRKTPVGSWEQRPQQVRFWELAQGRSPQSLEKDIKPDWLRDRFDEFRQTDAKLASARGCFAEWDQTSRSPIIDADRIVSGELPYFGNSWHAGGYHEDWTKDPVTGKSLSVDCHWSEIPDFGDVDIKLIWEPSRFAFVFPLVRAYARTGEVRFAKKVWLLAQSWRNGNPLNSGPNWMCGQETALRVIAWSFAWFSIPGELTDGKHQEAFEELLMIDDAGRRIAANINYALQQQNNHGISEAAGLWTIGLLFPYLPSAAAWRERGRRLLERQAVELIYDDGGFSQHSFNYQRLMLDIYLWSIQLGARFGQPLSDRLCKRVACSAELLYQLQDETTGQLPNYGQNDGALALPLTGCEARDFRPTLQAAWLLLHGERAYPPGPWDEQAWWLGLLPTETALKDDPQQQAPPRRDLQAAEGGYYTLRSTAGFASTRTARFRHRPSQADLLHVDLWWRGENIALDPGTFSYHQPAPWNNPLATTEVHNTVSIDEQDQMERVGRFLWLPWAKGSRLHSAGDETTPLAYWEGTHDGYRRLAPPVEHRRAILRLPEERWLVLDQLTSSAEHDYRLHWLLANVPHNYDAATRQLTLQTNAGEYSIQVGCDQEPAGLNITLVSAAPDSARGWQATGYLAREPALSLAAACTASQVRFWTLFGPGETKLNASPTSLTIQTNHYTATADFGQADQPLLESIQLLHSDGSAPETLRVTS